MASAASSSSSSGESDPNKNLMRIPNPDEWPVCCISLEPIDKDSVELPCRCSGSFLQKDAFESYIRTGCRRVQVVTTVSDPPTGGDGNGSNATTTVVMDRVASCPSCRVEFHVSNVKPLNKAFRAMLEDSAGVCRKCMKLLGKVSSANSGAEAIKHECDSVRIIEVENKIKTMVERRDRARRRQEKKRQRKQERKKKESEAEERIFFDQNGNNNDDEDDDDEDDDQSSEEDGVNSSSPKSTREKFLGGKADKNNNTNNGGAVAWSSTSSSFTTAEFISSSSSSNQQQRDDDDDYEAQSPFQRKVGAISQGAKDWMQYFQNAAVNGISKISGKK